MLITVFTPTYNRAHLLPRLYESLCKQLSGLRASFQKQCASTANHVPFYLKTLYI